MQVIVAYQGDPEDYVRNEAHLHICRPATCPNCRKSNRLRALGYYRRWVSISVRRNVISIMVRRFRCLFCHKTTSMLPDFAQPYRLVATDVVENYLGGSRSGDAVNCWSDLLMSYQRRFEARIDSTVIILESQYMLGELPPSAVDIWCEICRYFGDARRMTLRLISEAGVTVFGIYKCHCPLGKLTLHTTRMFSYGRAPPSCQHGHDDDPGTNPRH